MDEDRARELLAAERQRIERELAAVGVTISDVSRGDGPDDRVDQATDTYQAEFDEGRRDDLRAQLAALERAEQRLREGTYGLSVDSGKPIPDGRLEAFPTAERTADEQERRDRGG